MFDAVKVKDQCVAWIRNFFEENGPGCNAVVGISGGKDSSVAAALCVEALGATKGDVMLDICACPGSKSFGSDSEMK